MGKMTRVNEEKMLNEMFVLLEYSDSFYDFFKNMPPEMFALVKEHVKIREIRDNDGAI